MNATGAVEIDCEAEPMAIEKIYEGTPTELVKQLRSLDDERSYRMTLTTEEPEEAEVQTPEEALVRMTARTPEEIADFRERLFAATPAPRELPEGRTIFDVVMGTWCGDETDEQIAAALGKLS